MMRRCGDCIWWREASKIEDARMRPIPDVGYCYQGPPTTNRDGYGVWPLTDETDFCGQFHAREAGSDVREVKG